MAEQHMVCSRPLLLQIVVPVLRTLCFQFCSCGCPLRNKNLGMIFSFVYVVFVCETFVSFQQSEWIFVPGMIHFLMIGSNFTLSRSVTVVWKHVEGFISCLMTSNTQTWSTASAIIFLFAEFRHVNIHCNFNSAIMFWELFKNVSAYFSTEVSANNNIVVANTWFGNNNFLQIPVCPKIYYFHNIFYSNTWSFESYRDEYLSYLYISDSHIAKSDHMKPIGHAE